MGNNYIFTLTPTFTQGLVLGQLSILVLLALVLKYLFFISPESEVETVPFHSLPNPDPLRNQDPQGDAGSPKDEGLESAHWFNMLARQVCCQSLWALLKHVSCSIRLQRCTELHFKIT